MISLTRLNGDRIGVNPDLIERAEETPDTVLTLTNGTKYVVKETLDELVEKVQFHRAGILAIARRMADDPEGTGVRHLRLLRIQPDVLDTDALRAEEHPSGHSEFAGDASAPKASDEAAGDDPGGERPTP